MGYVLMNPTAAPTSRLVDTTYCDGTCQKFTRSWLMLCLTTSEMTLQSRLQTQPLASLIGFTAGQPVSVLAGAAITLANRTDLNVLSDIAHQRVCLSLLSCWQQNTHASCCCCKARTAATQIPAVLLRLCLTCVLTAFSQVSSWFTCMSH